VEGSLTKVNSGEFYERFYWSLSQAPIRKVINLPNKLFSYLRASPFPYVLSPFQELCEHFPDLQVIVYDEYPSHFNPLLYSGQSPGGPPWQDPS